MLTTEGLTVAAAVMAAVMAAAVLVEPSTKWERTSAVMWNDGAS